MNELNFRQAQIFDSVLLYQWANDPVVRYQAVTEQYIAWFDHLAWCKKQFSLKKNKIWIAELRGQAIGQVRFDEGEGSSLYVDIHLDERFRGQSLGLPLLIGSINLQFKGSDFSKISAVIKLTNGASLKLFLQAGFLVQNLFSTKGHWYWLLEKSALPLCKRSF